MCRKCTATNLWGDDDLKLYRISNSVFIMKKLVSPRCCQLLNLSINEILRWRPDCVKCTRKICVAFCKITFYRMVWRSAKQWESVQYMVISSQMAKHLISCIDINERQHMCLLYDKPTSKLLTLFIAYGSYFANVINKNMYECVCSCVREVIGVHRTFSKSKIRNT